MEVEKLTEQESSCQSANNTNQTTTKRKSAGAKRKSIGSVRKAAIAKAEAEIERLQEEFAGMVVDMPLFSKATELLCADIEHLKRIKRALENE